MIANNDTKANEFTIIAHAQLDALIDIEQTVFMFPNGWKFNSDVDESPQLVCECVAIAQDCCVDLEVLSCLLQQSLMLRNGCTGSAELLQCNAVAHGLFSRGLHAVLQYFNTAARDMLATRLQYSDGVTLQVGAAGH